MRKTLLNLAQGGCSLGRALGGGPLLRWLARQPAWAGPVADAYCRSGQICQAIDILERSIRRQVRSGAAPTPLAARRPIRLPPHRARVRCLVDLYRAMSTSPARPFLCFGTLLGLARTGDFLPDDPDIDIGLHPDELGCGPARDRLRAAGFTITKFEGPDWPCRLKLRHPQGAKIDLIFFQPHGDNLLTYTRYLGHLVVRRRTRFELAETDFLGQRVWVPDPPERFLEENYGDWRTPVDFFDCVLSSALTDHHQPIIQYRTRRLLAGLLKHGRRPQAAGLVRLVAVKQPRDPFWAWAAAHLDFGVPQP